MITILAILASWLVMTVFFVALIASWRTAKILVSHYFLKGNSDIEHAEEDVPDNVVQFPMAKQAGESNPWLE